MTDLVHQMFQRQAARSPDAMAVVCGEQRLTYRQLDQRANQVARRLAMLGLKPDDLVGVAMSRSPMMVVALFGVWKAGCAYVPLDPRYPEQRLRFMVRDAGLRLLLTDEASRRSFRDFGPGILSLDDDELDDLESNGSGDVSGSPSRLAYVMYTSGSTGQPKGAMITHAGLANYLSWAAAAYRVEAGGSVPVHSSLSFDLTVTSLFVPLLVGAHIELLNEEEGAAQALVAALRARRRSLVKLTPSHLELLNHELRPEELAGAADALVIGGENLMAERLAVWRECAPATRLINEYGPTETVVGCCIHEVTGTDPWSGPVPIGRPIADMRLYVLDEALQPLAPGAMGELYIGGPGVARGYLNRAELTRERFVPDPFSSDPEARLYRTGDLARVRDDGSGMLEYLGRADDQVKVRGYRIEMGEIEQALAGHPAVRACAALLHEDAAGGSELTAFAVSRGDASLSAEGLWEFARHRLPSYMLPARIVVLDALPLNHNGKVDRAALRAMAGTSATGCAPAQSTPRTPTEETVLEAFREAFQRGDIGIFDSFFDIGGHSMLAIRLMAALRQATGINLPLRNLYEHPTVAGLSEIIDALVWTDASPTASAPRPEETQGRSEVTF